MYVDGNVYFEGVKPNDRWANSIVEKDFHPEIKIIEKENNVYLHIDFDPSLWTMSNKLVTTDLPGKTIISEAGYEHPDGKPVAVEADFFCRKRDSKNPSTGPFEQPESCKMILELG